MQVHCKGLPTSPDTRSQGYIYIIVAIRNFFYFTMYKAIAASAVLKTNMARY